MKKNVYSLVMFTFLSLIVYSQGFTDINAGLTGLHWGDVAWGDYDNDGDLDVLVTGLDNAGTGNTILYKNNGNDNFSPLAYLNIPGTFVGDFAWGDYDGDGDLDILMAGYTDGDQITKIYKNGGDNSFGESGISFPALSDGSTSFVDYNNDGYVDVLIVGYNNTTYVAYLYKNNGNATFSDSGIELPGAIKSSYEWGDYDNDGDMDLFLTGFDINGELISKLFENNGNESFTVTMDNFTGTWLGDMAWGDYDNDGDLDILLSGYTLSTERIVKIYKNNNGGSFDEVLFTGLIGVSHCSTIWGDYDNDGDLDIFIGGTYEGSSSWVRVMDVFVNNGDDTFSPQNLSFTKDAYWGESAWGDYDNDGDLDLICSGHDDLGGSNTIIYRNENSSPNASPTTPENLSVDISDNSVLLSWGASTDTETPTAGLSYNAYIRNENEEIIWNSLSQIDNGFRLVPSIGNAQQNTSWSIDQLVVGNYFCGVQAVDHNFAGSEFSEEVPFTITYVGVENTNDHTNILSNYPNPFAQSTQITFSLKEPALVQIDIYNNQGQLVNSLVNQRYSAGNYTIEWQGKNTKGHQLIDGLYSYVLKVNGEFESIKKCLLIR
ncbi:MAG: T9SS type A sorting domain-containing protein [Bacteroidales bacterium]|nr:T9SS type A sorting domain-containing protein [Bacteroidales bacterium]